MPAPKLESPDGKCADCRPRKFAFDAVRTLGLYENDVRQAVLRIKHHEQEHLAMALGRALAARLQECPFPQTADLIVPVPMHWWNRLARGANPAETLSRSLASAVGLPVAGDLLRCRRMLRRQASLLPHERFQNVRGAFAVSRGFDIRGAKILLLDDVITTGATCDSAARALRKAGATHIFCLAVARGTGVRS